MLKIAHDQMRTDQNQHVLDDFQRNVHKINNDKQGCYVIFTVAEPPYQSNVKSNPMTSPPVIETLRRSGISMRFIMSGGIRYDSVVYLKNHQDINLMQVICADSINISKIVMAQDLIKKHNAICKKTATLIKKYCGF